MAEERWNDGRQYGLPPIGLPQADLSTPGSDTERRAFPGLATRGSVFAWASSSQTIYSYLTNAPPIAATINLRNNTTGFGNSVDVPTWAAGVVVRFRTYVDVLGVGITYHQFVLGSPVGPFDVIVTHNAVTQVNAQQVIVPFYDEPLISFSSYNNLGSGLGTQSTAINLIGFVRNV